MSPESTELSGSPDYWGEQRNPQWRGIGAGGVSFVTDRKTDMLDGHSWLAVAIDSDDGQVAVSIWSQNQRQLAMWLPDEAASRLRDELDEMLKQKSRS